MISTFRKLISIWVLLFSATQIQAESFEFIDCDPKIYNKYDVGGVKNYLVNYRNSQSILNPEARSIYGIILSELDEIELKGAHCYVSVLPDIYNNKEQLITVIETHFEKIGKAEHLYRLFETIAASLSHQKKVRELKKLMASQRLLIERLYAQEGLNYLLSIAKGFRNDGLLTPREERLVDLAYVDHVRQTAIPEKLSNELAYIKSEGKKIFTQVRRNGSEDIALSWLKKVFSLQTQIGEVIQEKLGLETPYDGLLALYQPGFDSRRLDVLYERLIPEMSSIANKVTESQKDTKPSDFPSGPYLIEKQASFNSDLTNVFGIDRTRYLIDFSNAADHIGGIRSDIHLVVNINGTKFTDFISSTDATIAGLGLGMYIDSIPENEMFTPMGKLMGSGVENGYVSLMDKILGRAEGFISYFAKRATYTFEKDIDEGSLNTYKKWIYKSPERDHADEVTHGLHTFIRMDIERSIINGEREVSEIPSQWRVMYHKLLQSTPKSAKVGYLQDSHWFVGQVGVFPFLTVGDAVAAQMWHFMKKRYPNAGDMLARGKARELRLWLQDNFGQQGRYADLDDYMKATTSQPLNPSHLVRHWKERYLNQ